MLYDVFIGTLLPYLIDFGIATDDFNEIKGSSPYFFNNGTTRTPRNAITFNNPEERTKAELHCLAIILLDITLLSMHVADHYKNE